MEIIGQITSTEEFREAFAKAVGSKKGVDEIEAELKSLRKSLHSEEHKNTSLVKTWIIWMCFQMIMKRSMKRSRSGLMKPTTGFTSFRNRSTRSVKDWRL